MIRAVVLIVLASILQAQSAPRQFELKAESPRFWELFAADAKLEKVAGGFGFTEGPVWDEKGFLYVSDEQQNKISRVFPDGRVETVLSVRDPDGSTFDKRRRLITCLSTLRSVAAIAADGSYTILADKFEGKKLNSPNDVVLGPDGALYFTDPTIDLPKDQTQEAPHQGVYRLADDGSLKLLTKDLEQPNGLAFSPDGKRLYIDDSKRREIRVFDVGPGGELSNGRLFGKEEGRGGVPDGMRVDSKGNLFVTGPQGVWVWDADGNHLGTIVMPEQPANLAWGDSDYATLYFTARTSVYRLKTKTHGVASTDAGVVRVDATPTHVINSFDPDSALGSSIDVLSRTGIDKVYTPHIIQEALSAGWGPITYRNNTELRMAAWHWTENGTWSDPLHKSGYFTGSSDLKEPIRYILAYALPHRGPSASGDRPPTSPALTYWKSNPYLSSKFTGESDSLHPQWVVTDLRSERQIGAIEIAWASPYARTYQVDYWVGQSPFGRAPVGQWRTFPAGVVKNAAGGAVVLKVADSPVAARYLRVWMTESSNTCDVHGPDDVRNCVGYAIQGIRAGTLDANGGFVDVAANAAVNPSEQEKPGLTTSSIDPWHSAEDVNATGSYQHSGFDLFYTSGLTNNLPAMIPVTMLYGTPEDSAAQIAYIKKRGYPIGWIEMGEEPDGKHMMPEDYGALYIQWATAIHKVDPKLKLGGPVFEGINEDIKVWPNAEGKTSWTERFVDYLKAHGRLSELSFWSLEHYPFAPCNITWKDLYREPQMMSHILHAFWENGLPKNIPIMVTESHISWRLTGPMSTIFAALWLADNIGSFFEAGGAAFYHSPIQPQPVNNTCLGWASWSNFIADRDYNITGYTSPYYAARMINVEWVQHRSGVHRMYPSSTDVKDGEGNALVTSYAVQRPDGNWSLMLVNRDETSPHTVRVVLEDSQSKSTGFFAGPITLVTFGSEQYVWKDDGANSHADPDGPPVATVLPGGRQASFTLPKASVTVLRGKVEGLAH